MTLQEKSELVRLLNLYQADLLVQGRNTVCFTGGEEDYIVVTESLGDIYERIQSAEKRYRKRRYPKN